MNVITRGAKNTLRSPLRSGAIIAMLAISTGLILAMLVARNSVNAKIEEVKASVATQITINPAGSQGGMGSGDPLTAEQVEKIKNTEHVNKVDATLTSQLSTDDTSLQSALEPGKLMLMGPNGATEKEGPKPPIVASGVTSTTVTEDKLTSGAMIDLSSTEYVALLGKKLAEKNNLTVGDTFTMYGKTFTVKGIYSTDNRFQDSNLIVPLATLQEASDQSGEVSSVIATIDSSDNVSSATTALKEALGDDADVTSQEEQAEVALAPLNSIAGLALGGVIAATIAGAGIILLAMVMVVRERRREIGVIKAIGGTNRSIITQFVTEGLTLTFVGAAIGFVVGVAASGPLTQSLVSNQTNSNSQTQGGMMKGPMNTSGDGSVNMRGPGMGQNGGMMLRPQGPNSLTDQVNASIKSVTGSVTPQTFIASGAIIILIAIIGSGVPAWAIARIRPAEVLRTE